MPHLLSSIELLYFKIGMGVSSKKTKGIDAIKPITFEYNVIVSGSILLERSLVMIIIMANVIIVITIHVTANKGHSSFKTHK